MGRNVRSKIQEQRLGLTGKAKFFHKLARFILFPIFHPFMALALIFVLWFCPTLMGVKPSNVHNWYWQKIVGFVKTELVMPVADNKIPNLNIKKGNFVGIAEIKKPVNTYDVNTRREMFFKANEKQKSINTNKEIVVKTAAVSVEKNEKKQDFGLNYLKFPEIVKGKAVVINANQLLINDKYMYFYGIYIDPTSKKGLETKEYIKNLINDDDVECKIIAYSDQGAATAYCSHNGVELNYLLIEKKLSNNVSLGK